ncbi:MAG TPA: cyclic pyranopterin monophosphate synthase MoaC [Nitrososphaerales archaeon]|nr:cyclic pyranopterin monophosphate synthase MoaC [Nitrososphaerales archaeon]
MGYRQVDISGKTPSSRTATASGRILLRRRTVELIRAGSIEKGEPLSLAKITGIMAAKMTPQLVVLCHPLKIESTRVEATLEPNGVEVTATVSATEKTGVEMEALTAVVVALLNVWDVVKPYEKDGRGQYPMTRIDGVKVLRKAK